MKGKNRLFLAAVIGFIVFLSLAPASPLGEMLRTGIGTGPVDAIMIVVGLLSLTLVILSHYWEQVSRYGMTSRVATLRTLAFTVGLVVGLVVFKAVQGHLGLPLAALLAGVAFAAVYAPVDVYTRRGLERVRRSL